MRGAVYFHSLEEPAWGAFENLVAYFDSRDYRFVTPAEICEEGPRPAVFLSFDDKLPVMA